MCSGNICRSPLAEYVARRTFGESVFTFQSVGTHGHAGFGATPEMIAVGDDLDVDLRPHRSRGLSEITQPDLFLCMDQWHIDACARAFPEMPAESIRLLADRPVPDPYGLDARAYAAVGQQIERAIAALDLGISGT